MSERFKLVDKDQAISEGLDLTEAEIKSVLDLIYTIIRGCNMPISAALSLLMSVSGSLSSELATQSNITPKGFKEFCRVQSKKMQEVFNSARKEKK